MNSQHEDVHDQVGAYVLDALAPDEQTTFEEHLAGCDQCQVEVAELRQVVDVLPLAVEVAEPAPALRERILSQARAETGDRPVLTSIPGGSPRQEASKPAHSWLRSREVWIAAVAAVLIVALGVANLQLRSSKSQQTASERDVVTALAHGATVTRLSPTQFAPGASASLIQPRSGNGYLVVAGLPKTEAPRVYELWFIRNAVPSSAGTFTYVGTSAQVVPVQMSSHGYSTTAVTNEPRPSPRPRGYAVLAGRIGA